MTLPDVVIPVRRGERNEELRYALRSLRNLPHGRVWLAGHRPTWVSDEVGHVPTVQNSTKHANALRNLLTACRQPGVSEDYYLWNDDMFLLRPLEALPVLHRGPLRWHVDQFAHYHSAYHRGLKATMEILQAWGHAEPLSYEMHTPLPMTKLGTIDVVERARERVVGRTATPLQVKSLFGNAHELGGFPAEDVKVFRAGDGWTPEGRTFLSTVDSLWGRHPACDHLKALFPDPGPYERS